jgi:hypothetical protein
MLSCPTSNPCHVPIHPLTLQVPRLSGISPRASASRSWRRASLRAATVSCGADRGWGVCEEVCAHRGEAGPQSLSKCILLASSCCCCCSSWNGGRSHCFCSCVCCCQRMTGYGVADVSPTTAAAHRHFLPPLVGLADGSP